MKFPVVVPTSSLLFYLLLLVLHYLGVYFYSFQVFLPEMDDSDQWREYQYIWWDIGPMILLGSVGAVMFLSYLLCAGIDCCAKISTSRNCQGCTECLNSERQGSYKCDQCTCEECNNPCSCPECKTKRCSCVEHKPERCSCSKCHKKLCATCFCTSCKAWKCQSVCDCPNCHSNCCDCECACSCEYCKCLLDQVCVKVRKTILWLVSELVKLVYGDEFNLVKEQPESDEIDESGRINMYIGRRPIKPSSLHICLGLKSILVLTFLAMVFSEIFFVKSIPGCHIGLDCYRENNDWTEYPINCSDSKYSNTSIVCYTLELGSQNAIGVIGGILIMSRVGIALLSKTILACTSFSINCRRKNQCCICCNNFLCVYLPQLSFGVAFVVAYYFAVRNIFKAVHETPTVLRTVRYGLQYATFGGAIFMTIAAPWYKLISTKCNCKSMRPEVRNGQTTNGTQEPISRLQVQQEIYSANESDERRATDKDRLLSNEKRVYYSTDTHTSAV